MNLLNVSLLIVTSISFAGAESQPKAELIAKDVTIAASDHAFVNKDEVVLMQGRQRFAIPVKSITAVSSTAANALSINVGSSTLAEAPSVPQLVRSKDHYVGIVWTDKSKTSGVVVKVGSGEYWTLLPALEAAGIKVVNADAFGTTK